MAQGYRGTPETSNMRRAGLGYLPLPNLTPQVWLLHHQEFITLKVIRLHSLFDLRRFPSLVPITPEYADEAPVNTSALANEPLSMQMKHLLCPDQRYMATQTLLQRLWPTPQGHKYASLPQ